MADLIRLAMWSGCRIEELCALEVADVNGDRFRVREAKSSAVHRDPCRTADDHGAADP